LPRQPVIRGPARHGVHQVFTDQRRDRFRKPAVQHVQDPLADQTGAQHTAVEQNMRRRRVLALQKITEMARDGRVGCVRQPELGEASATPLRHFVQRHFGKEAIQQDAIDIGALQFGLEGSSHHSRAAPKNCDGVVLGALAFGKQLFLAGATLLPQRVELDRIQLRQSLGDLMRQSDIDIIAAEKNMFADGDALERELPRVIADRNQAEVRGSAAISTTRIRSPTPTRWRQSW